MIHASRIALGTLLAAGLWCSFCLSPLPAHAGECTGPGVTGVFTARAFPGPLAPAVASAVVPRAAAAVRAGWEWLRNQLAGLQASRPEQRLPALPAPLPCAYPRTFGNSV